jgi:hypothetical protein
MAMLAGRATAVLVSGWERKRRNKDRMNKNKKQKN